VQFLSNPLSSDANGIAGEDDTGGLQSIAGDEEEKLDIADQDVIAMAAAEG
jgi:hypothetical protein